MDVNAIKSNGSSQAPASGDQVKGAAFSLGSSALSFFALMQNTKSRLAGNITAMMESNVLSRSIEGAEPVSRPVERAPDKDRDDAYDPYPERGDGADRPNDRVDAPRGDDRGDRDDDRGDRDGRQAVERGGERTAKEADDGGDYETRHEQPAGDGDQAADAGGADDASTGDRATGEGDETVAGTPSATEGSTEAAGEAQTAGQRAQELLSGLLATGQALPGQAANQAVESTGDTPRQNAQEGLLTALGAVSKQSGAQGGGANHPGAHESGQRIPGQVQTALQATIQSSAEAETANSANTATQQQAAALSKAIGEGNRLSVQVDVTDEAANLISKPRFTLTSKAVLGGEDGGQARNSHSFAQGNAHAGLQGALNLAAQQAAGPAQGQIQQAAGQLTQTLVAQAAAAKGLVQAAVQGGSATAGDAPVSAGLSGTTETPQTQQANAAQAANAQRPLAQGKAVAEQVSVQITKAIEAGVDRISIQLRPESLGRIDVKLDIGLDGRVTVVVTADNKNTLDLMERDQRSLEQALRDAGLDTDAGNMSFNLREQDPDGADRQTAGSAAPEDEPAETVEDDLDGLLAAIDEDGFGPDGRVDIRA